MCRCDQLRKLVTPVLPLEEKLVWTPAMRMMMQLLHRICTQHLSVQVVALENQMPGAPSNSRVYLTHTSPHTFVQGLFDSGHLPWECLRWQLQQAMMV